MFKLLGVSSCTSKGGSWIPVLWSPLSLTLFPNFHLSLHFILEGTQPIAPSPFRPLQAPYRSSAQFCSRNLQYQQRFGEVTRPDKANEFGWRKASRRATQAGWKEPGPLHPKHWATGQTGVPGVRRTVQFVVPPGHPSLDQSLARGDLPVHCITDFVQF